MGDVEEEAVPDAKGRGGIDRGPEVTLDQDQAVLVLSDHQLRQAALGSRNEGSILVGKDEGLVGAVEVVEADTELQEGLCLDGVPGREPAVVCRVHDPVVAEPVEERARGLEAALRGRVGRGLGRGARVELVLSQQDLSGGVARVGLLLVDVVGGAVERRGAVVCRAQEPVRTGVAARAGHHLEVLGSGGVIVERVVGGERHDDHAVSALLDEVEAVVEELTEEGDERVRGRGQTLVRGGVRDEELVLARDVGADLQSTHLFRCTSSRDGSGVANGVVRDEVADQAGLAVLDGSSVTTLVGGLRAHDVVFSERPEFECLRVRKLRLCFAREGLICSAELLEVGQQVVAAAVDGTEAPRQQCARDELAKRLAATAAPHVLFGDLDLVEDELEILSLVGEVRRRRRRRGRGLLGSSGRHGASDRNREARSKRPDERMQADSGGTDVEDTRHGQHFQFSTASLAGGGSRALDRPPPHLDARARTDRVETSLKHHDRILPHVLNRMCTKTHSRQEKYPAAPRRPPVSIFTNDFSRLRPMSVTRSGAIPTVWGGMSPRDRPKSAAVSLRFATRRPPGWGGGG